MSTLTLLAHFVSPTYMSTFCSRSALTSRFVSVTELTVHVFDSVAFHHAPLSVAVSVHVPGHVVWGAVVSAREAAPPMPDTELCVARKYRRGMVAPAHTTE